jgi:hypothetical protein
MVGDKTYKKVKTFNCPSCGADVKISIQGQSLTVVCNSCSSLIDTFNDNYQVIQKNLNKISRKLIIPLGTKGELNGKQWEVTGYVEKRDGEYIWSEYLLFNPFYGYRWLTEIEGHWTLYAPIKYRSSIRIQHRKPKPHILNFKNTQYKLFNSGEAKIEYVLGEFYWRIRVGDTSEVVDYINPPYQVSIELEPDEINWTQGEYIDSVKIRNAFKLERVPLHLGIASNQINPHLETKNFIKKANWFFIGLIFIIQFYFILFSASKEVYKEDISLTSSDISKPRKSVSFDLPVDSKNFEVYFRSPIANNWIEFAVSLVHEESGESIDKEIGIEYYFGSDGGESWTEGSQEASLFYNSLPKGKYHLIIEPSGSVLTATDSNLPVYISAKSDVTVWSNFIWSFLLILIAPIYYAIKSYNFEFTRWSNSDYSPYE